MRNCILRIVLVAFVVFDFSTAIVAQKNLENQISDSLTAIANCYTKTLKLNTTISIHQPSKTLFVTANSHFAQIPFRPENVKRIYNAISIITVRKYAGYSIICQVENKRIEDLIPNFFRNQAIDSTIQFSYPAQIPLLKNTSKPLDIQHGLQSRNIALWQSHGFYYNQKKMRWDWQRARVFQVVEDLYTQSYVLPYVVPMLENAGATVLLPRERDTQLNEIIIDNDTKDSFSKYREHSDQKRWIKGDTTGFGNSKKFYLTGENPFSLGTYRSTQTINSTDEFSTAEWVPSFFESGNYAVYVSYKTVENSTNDAHYAVIHRGIRTEFVVNQQMNGGTWLYLGNFKFEKGKPTLNKVVLTNYSEVDGKILTADAVKFGGGMGNIARSPFENPQNPLDSITPKIVVEPEISHYPRYTEGARYWLQWAGMPDSIYSRTKGLNDYSDDFQSRGFWVNHLTAGSVLAPEKKGLGVPIDMALAFHSDAGFTMGDSIIGTLGITSIPSSSGVFTFQNGLSRWASRDLTDIVQTQIVDDIRKVYAPEWTRRGLWNKSYSESRVPEVPTMLLELLSHQNFADMRYGLDPRFRFLVSRAIYKGVLKYLSSANNQKYIVQPLPVEQFCTRFVGKNKLKLSWKAVIDSIEPTAVANKYMLYTKIDDGDFDNGMLINADSFIVNIATAKIYSFKVTAVNDGGESFPSETLSACRVPNDKPEVLIVNGFNRISAPASFAIDSIYAGFLTDFDPGVPYQAEISFIGKQFEFNRSKTWISDDSPGFGASNANFETKVIAGNTFDYPFIHGKAIKDAGFSFVSSSCKALTDGNLSLQKYKFVDLILGKQKQTQLGSLKKTIDFKTFPIALQHTLRVFTQTGGNLMVSGSFIASDICESANSTPEDKDFIENVLKINFRTSHASVGGNVKVLNSPLRFSKKIDISYFDTPNSTSYYVESPDAIEPNAEGAFSICRYAENNKSAGVAFRGNYKLCTFGFPFETIKEETDRTVLMNAILTFFNSKE